jgi:hypothetical protein
MLTQTAAAISPIGYMVKTIQSPAGSFSQPDMKGPRLFMSRPLAD